MFCDDLEGWDEGVGGRLKREGMHVYKWLIHLVVQQKQARHYKAIIHQNKQTKNQSHFLTPGEVKVVRGLSVRETKAATFKQVVDRNPDILVGKIQ